MPGSTRIAFVGTDDLRARVFALVASAGFESTSHASAAHVIVVALTGAPARQRRHATTVVEASRPGPVVLITGLRGRVDLQRLVETGALGVVLLDRLDGALGPTLHAVRQGQICAPAEVGGQLAPRALTRREKEVMVLVAMGLTNADIARRLHVVETTVKTHVATSLRKLGVRSRSEAAQLVLNPDERAGAGIAALDRSRADPPSLAGDLEGDPFA